MPILLLSRRTALQRLASDAGFSESDLDELQAAVVQMLLDVLHSTAAEVIHDAHVSTLFQQCVNQMRADELCSSRNNYLASLPGHSHLLDRFVLYWVSLPLPLRSIAGRAPPTKC